MPLNKIVKQFVARAEDRGEESHYFWIGLAAAMIANIVFAGLRYANEQIDGKATGYWINVVGAVGLALLTVVYWRNHRHFRLVLHLGLALCAFCLVLPERYGMISSPWWLAILPLTATLLIGPRAGLSWVVICIALNISTQLLAPRFIHPDAAGEAWSEAIASRAMLMMVLFGIALRFRKVVTRLARLDALTQLPNRLAVNERLQTEFLSMKRSKNVYAVLMMDIDFFKRVNDTHGHAVGDQVLQRVATTMKATLRKSDFCARFGGEEFLALLPATDMPAAYQVAEKLRLAVLASPDPIAGRITVSIGLALPNPEQADEDIAIREADEALYRAKSAGRNQVQVATKLLAQVKAGDAVPAELVQLVWRSDYECGNQTIDAQHRELFHGANQLLSAVLNGLPSQDVTAMVDGFIADVVQHFQDEEAILTKAGYPATSDHAILHCALVEKASELVTHFREGTLSLGELFKFLAQDVVSRHMLTADRAYFSHLRSSQ